MRSKRSFPTIAVVVLLQVGPGLVSLRAQQAQSVESVRQLLSQGEAAMKRGDMAAAEAAFKDATLAAPTLSDPFLALGLIQLRSGALEAAQASLGRAAQLNPQLKGPHLFLGIAEYQMGHPELASEDLQAELRLNAANLEALTWLGIVNLGSAHPGQAAAALDQAVSLAPTNPQVLYYQAKAHAQVAEEALSKLYQLDPDSALVHRASAENLASSGQPEKAIAEYQLALAKQPGNPDLLEGLGEQQQKLSLYDEAGKTYELALRLNPTSSIAMYNLGKMDVEHGHPAEGVPLLQKAVDAHAKPAPTDFYLGYGLAQLGREEEAVRWLEQAVASQPSVFIEQSAYFQLARAYQHLGRKEEARAALEKLKLLKSQASPGIMNSNAAVRPGVSGTPIGP